MSIRTKTGTVKKKEVDPEFPYKVEPEIEEDPKWGLRTFEKDEVKKRKRKPKK